MNYFYNNLINKLLLFNGDWDWAQSPIPIKLKIISLIINIKNI